MPFVEMLDEFSRRQVLHLTAAAQAQMTVLYQDSFPLPLMQSPLVAVRTLAFCMST